MFFHQGHKNVFHVIAFYVKPFLDLFINVTLHG